jgi:signal transduction histidine kinase
MFDAQGRPMGVLQIVHDIRAERSARARADAMAGRQRALADAALDTLLATLDLDGRVLEWSRGAEALTGHAAAHALGRTLDTLLPGGFDSTGCLRRARIDGHCDVRLHSHGRRFEGSLYSLGLAPGSARFGLILRDASGHAAAQQQLEATRDELTQLNRRLLAQERQTSQRLAQSLHDELGQTLAALRLHWDVYRGAAAEQRQKLDDRIAQLVVQANRQVRGVLAELRPPLLDELGLAAAIDNEIRQHQPADGDARMTLQAGHDAQLQRWPADVEYAAFMVAREALLNALRHAGAAHITVRLDGDEHLLALSVSDDGQGLVPGPGDGETGRMGHLGLVGMRERALAIDAQLRIDGQPGRGTIVGLTWESAEAPDEVLAEVPADESHLPD